MITTMINSHVTWIGRTVTITEGFHEGQVVTIIEAEEQDIGFGPILLLSYELGGLAWCATVDEVDTRDA